MLNNEDIGELFLTPREKLLTILNALKDRIASPSDVIAVTGLPRYEVLAAFHVLEALSIVEVVYTRGNYKIYRLSETGKKLLDILLTNKKFTFATADGSDSNPAINAENIATTSSSAEAGVATTA
ncbi:MAG: hypothetical protein QW320_07060 [Ignisphaera sp.]